MGIAGTPAAARRLAVGLLCVTLGMAVGEPASAQEPPETGATEPGESPEPTQPDAGPQLELVDQTTWVRQGETFNVRVRTTAAPPGAVLQLVVHNRLTSRSAFAATFDGVLGGTLATPISEPLDVLPRAPDGATALTFGVGDGGVGVDREGVYPVEVLLTDETGTTLASLDTFLLLLPNEDFPPLSVAMLMEVGASPGLQPDGTIRFTPSELSQIATRVEALRAVPDMPMTVAPVPETLDALAHSPEPTPQLLDDLVTGSRAREILAKPYVDVDLASWADAGLMGNLAPELDAGLNAVRARYEGVEPTANVWLPGQSVEASETASWSDRGIERAVLPESAVDSVSGLPVGTMPSGSVVLPTNRSSDDIVAFVSDLALLGHLLGDQGRLDAHRFVSELAMIWFERPADRRGVVIRIPEQEPFDAELVSRALQEVRDAAALQPVTLTELFETVPPAAAEQPSTVELAPKQPSDEDLGWMAEPLDRGRETLAGLADSVDDPSLLDRLRRSLLIAPGARTTSDQRRAYIASVDDAANLIAGSVSAPSEFRITLTAREGTIPLTIANTSNQDVAVVVRLDSNRLEFPEGELVDVVVPPGGTRIDLRVRTRTSGAFPLDITLTSPGGNIVLDETTFDIRSTAVSGVGLVLSLGAGLFLLVWWTRHWRNSRRVRLRRSSQTPNHVAV